MEELERSPSFSSRGYLCYTGGVIFFSIDLASKGRQDKKGFHDE
jgi:hypothetical protein